MSILVGIIVFLSGFLAGAINAIAGGGTFLTFGALTLFGVPPILANTTSSLTQLPGYVASSFAYKDEIRAQWKKSLVFCAVSAMGALGGALLLLALDNAAFRAAVPWLLLGATLVFAAGPWLKPKPKEGPSSSAGSILGACVQFVTSIYGGFFGAGMGVMMLASLGLTQSGSYHQLNALKNFLSIIIALVAVVIFVGSGAIAWDFALVMLPGVFLGGYAGVWVARKLPVSIVRSIVIIVGLLLSYYYYSAN